MTNASIVHTIVANSVQECAFSASDTGQDWGVAEKIKKAQRGNFRASDDLMDRLKMVAKSKDVAVSWLVRQYVKTGLEQDEIRMGKSDHK